MKEELVAVCDKDGLLGQSCSSFLLFGIMARHREMDNCNAKSWVETMEQYTAGLRRKELLIELARKQKEAFKNTVPGAEG